MPSRSIVITATDDGYVGLALDMVRSLRRAETSFAFDIGVLDLGLSEESKQKLTQAGGVIFQKPKVDIDYPGREAWEAQAPFYRCLTARPFLRDYFPGYDVYMWMDSDAWLQTPDALENILPHAAKDDAVYIAAEFDRDYAPFFASGAVWMKHASWYKAHFPPVIAQEMMFRPMFNCGIFALSPRAPVWDLWVKLYKESLSKISVVGYEHFMVDQLCMNIALYLGPCPYRVMPAEYNWLSMYSMPLYDEERKLYVRPTTPQNPVSVIHIAGKNKLQEAEIKTVTGKTVKQRLTFSALFPEEGVSTQAPTGPRFHGDRL